MFHLTFSSAVKNAETSFAWFEFVVKKIVWSVAGCTQQILFMPVSSTLDPHPVCQGSRAWYCTHSTVCHGHCSSSTVSTNNGTAYAAMPIVLVPGGGPGGGGGGGEKE